MSGSDVNIYNVTLSERQFEMVLLEDYERMSEQVDKASDKLFKSAQKLSEAADRILALQDENAKLRRKLSEYRTED